MAAPCSFFICWLLLAANIQLSSSQGWDNEELELFDLVEEVNQNFYELMGVDQSASSSEIRRAYRRLSLQLHPDKNKEENAEEKFRQLVAVHDVLRDSEKRDKYNSILEHGLPDWRQPVYYYRKVRKMGLIEMVALLTVILSIGQYFVAWASYLEKKFEIEEVLSSRIKKDRKSRKAKLSNREEIHDLIEDEISALPKPRIRDLLPFKLTYLAFHTCINLPTYCRMLVTQYKDWQEEKRRRKEEEEEERRLRDEPAEVVKKPKKKKLVELPQYSDIISSSGEPVVYQEMIDTSQDTEGGANKKKKKGEWDDEEIAMLIKAVAKFPGGAPRRWEKIAQFVGRPVSQVVSMAKQVNASSGAHISTAFQGTTGANVQANLPKKGRAIREDDISQRVDFETSDKKDSDSELRQRHKPEQTSESRSRTVENGESAIEKNAVKNVLKMEVPAPVNDESQVWNQNQQKILEWALSQYPKTTSERWDKIAQHIPGKTKEQCIIRVKHLAELVKKKKQGLA